MILKEMRSRIGGGVLRGVAVSWFVFLTACLDPLPEVVLECKSNIECPSGICSNGECAPVATLNDIPPTADGLGETDQFQADTTQPSDGVDGAADVLAPCEENVECLGRVEGLGPCEEPFCDDGVCKSQPLSKGDPCTVGGVCPISGSCSGIVCETGDKKKCDDDNDCTVDACGPDGCSHKAEVDGLPCPGDQLFCTAGHCATGECINVVKTDHCLIAGLCYVQGAYEADSPCLRCEPKDAATQLSWTPITSGSCDDGDWCTVTDDCDLNSNCSGLPVDCLDDNPCTNSSCDSVKGCVHMPNQATCSDDDPCTLFGTCGDGKCGPGKKISCDDGNPCTTDKCEPQIGCVYTPNEADCIADADPCTKDHCLGGACIAVPAVNVCKIAGTCVAANAKADANPCLICHPATDAKSWTLLIGAACDDGNKCTVGDICTKGNKCEGEPAACFDNNICTADSCSPDKGCVFTAVGGKCDDDSACTLDDKCLAGKCLGTSLEPKDCADGNPCTTDGCDAGIGCTHTPNNAPCDDGDKCTKGDICSAAKCIAGGVVCPCETNADCSDGNPCTQDVCIKGTGCINPLSDPKQGCNDGNKCTSGDHCVNGLCQGKTIDCDDENACTKDSCGAKKGCSYIDLQGIKCSDSSACTKADLCLQGECKGTPKNCDDGDPCSDDWCDPGSGACGHFDAADGSPCASDGVACTIDQCHNGKCDHDDIKAEFCLIGGFCYSGGAPHSGKQCLGCQPLKNAKDWSVLTGNGCNDYDACTYDTTCNKQGSCVGKPTDCNDNNSCTKDACNPQAAGGNGCVHLAVGGPCNDGNKCTTNDVCNGGTCGGELVKCDDGNTCTIDDCGKTIGCFVKPAANGLACASDGQECTVDLCEKGACAHQPIDGWCLIGGQCISASTKAAGKPCMACVPSAHILDWTFVAGGPCDDGDPCTGADACDNGGCQGDPDKACDDGNPCTDDSCNAANGCSHKANKAGCDDGNACTVGDTCAAGKCLAGGPLKCTQKPGVKDCTVQACKPDQGCVKVSTCGALHTCVAGLCLTQTPAGATGAVKIPLGGLGASQPMRPTLAWQESHSGELGSVPQLWLAAQTRGCAPIIGLYSKLFLVGFRPGKLSPVLQSPATPQPGGGSNWCATHPVLRPHPTTFNALALGWLEGGAPKGACDIGGKGGQVRVGLVGVGGAGTKLAKPAPCPVGAGPMPLAHRPAFSLLTGSAGGVLTPAQLGGLLFRGHKKGLLWYDGSAVTKWGAADGKLLPLIKAPGKTETFTGSRAVATPWTKGNAMLAVSHLQTAAGWGEPILTAMRFDDKGEALNSRKVIASGVQLSGTEPTYHAVEAVYHGQSKRIGALISGSVVDKNNLRSFLAFLRVDPDQSAVAGPKIVVYHDQLKAKAKLPAIRAFRLAALPGGGFLVIWAAPGGNVLKSLLVKPTNDVDFVTKDLPAISGNFEGHVDGDIVSGSGGLSEIVIDASLTRYSVAWEGVGAMHLLTAALPKP